MSERYRELFLTLNMAERERETQILSFLNQLPLNSKRKYLEVKKGKITDIGMDKLTPSSSGPSF